MKPEGGGTQPAGSESNGAVAPFWQVEREFAPEVLTADATVDVAIIGGGIAGLSTAHALSQSGINCAVFESGSISEGSTGWCAGILSLDTTIDSSVAQHLFGAEQAREYYAKLGSALDDARRQFGRDADWVTGSALYVSNQANSDALTEEATSRQQLGLLSNRFDGLNALGLRFGAALELKGENAVHPVKLALALAKSVQSVGNRVYERSCVSGWLQIGQGFLVFVNGRCVAARHLVICTGLSAMQSHLGPLSKLLVPATSHVLVTEPRSNSAALREASIIALWDAEQLYHYVRYLPDGRMLVGGEELCRTGEPKVLPAQDKHIARLFKWASLHHTFEIPPVERAWCATLIVPAHGLPILHRTMHGGNQQITLVTDGLPSALLLGQLVAKSLRGELPNVPPMLTGTVVPNSARMLQWLPARGLLRRLALHAGFAALRVRDALGI